MVAGPAPRHHELNDRIAPRRGARYTGNPTRTPRQHVTPQEEFDAKYITSTEICRDLDVTRASVTNARDRGALPEPVRINRANGDPHIMIWLRAEAEPHIAAWRLELQAKRAA
jgi:hypothetical protein